MILRLLFLSCCLSALWGQVADDATLKKYLDWQESQPPVQSWDQEEFLARYRAKLDASGLNRAAADQAITALSHRLDADEAAFWSKIYSDRNPGFNTSPNRLLQDAIRGRKPGRALDVEMGQGRHAIFLAEQGWEVTGFDFSPKALELAQQQAKKAGLKIETVLSKDDAFDFGKDRWDLMVFLYPMEKRSYGKAREALAPGGIVVVEGFHQEVKGAAIRYASNELLQRFDGFIILYYEDSVGLADWGKTELRLVKLVAQKPR